jgi:hypothetical protein
VIPTEKLKHGLDVAKGLWSSTLSRARKSIEDINQSETMQKVRSLVELVARS